MFTTLAYQVVIVAFQLVSPSVQYCINGGLTERREEQVGLLFNLEIARLYNVSIAFKTVSTLFLPFGFESVAW